jgi:hypothetical protein
MDASALGRCPSCDTIIPRLCLLIEYETEDGWPTMFAECPGCGEVVHPQGTLTGVVGARSGNASAR